MWREHRMAKAKSLRLRDAGFVRRPTVQAAGSAWRTLKDTFTGGFDMKIAFPARHVLALVAALSASAVAAEEAAPISANVSLTSDYVWRGESQSDEDPAIQGGFDFVHSSGFYIGTWGSTVAIGDAELELDYYVGYKTELGGFGLDLGLAYIDYPGSSVDGWPELYISVDKDFGAFSANAGFRFSNDFAATDENGYYVYLGGSVPVGPVSLNATVGYTSTDDTGYAGGEDDWLHYQIGVSASFAGVDFDLSYHGTDVDDYELMDDRVVFTVSKSF